MTVELDHTFVWCRDDIFGRIVERGLDRGVYFAHPDGHLLEIITRPYGSGA